MRIALDTEAKPEMPAPADQTERPHTERQPRRRALKAGVISYHNSSVTCACIVRDQSDGGARLQHKEIDIPIPDRFSLTIPIDGVVADCTVRWRKGDMLGVAFEGPVREELRVRRIQSMNAEFIAPRKPGSLRKQQNRD